MIPERFLQAILAAPGDDTPRLVLCDFLEEHGDEGDRERSAFIRVQCGLEKMRPTLRFSCSGGGLPEALYARVPRDEWARWYENINATVDYEATYGEAELAGVGYVKSIDLNGADPVGEIRTMPVDESHLEKNRFRRRERELLARHGCDWLTGMGGRWVSLAAPGHLTRGPAIGFISPFRGEVDFARGFVSAVTLTLADWLAHGPAIVRSAPVTTVTLSDREPLETRPLGGPAAFLAAWRERERYGREERYTVPACLFALLTGDLIGTWETRYPSREAALADLSAACLRWAKEEADRLGELTRAKGE